MSVEITNTRNLTPGKASGEIGFFAIEGSSGGPKDGVFYFEQSLNFKVLAVTGLAVTEGSLGAPHIGDAALEVISMNWDKNGNIHAVVGEWHRKDLQADGTRRPYTRDIGFLATIAYLTA